MGAAKKWQHTETNASIRNYCDVIFRNYCDVISERNGDEITLM